MRKPSSTTISIKQKINLILFGILLSLIILEGGLRFGGWIYQCVKNYDRVVRTSNADEVRILCIGESTTEGEWPPFLESILNKKDNGMNVRVIDKGRGGIILSQS